MIAVVGATCLKSYYGPGAEQDDFHDLSYLSHNDLMRGVVVCAHFTDEDSETQRG